MEVVVVEGVVQIGVGRSQLPVHHFVPVEGREPGVRFDLLCTPVRSKPSQRVLFQKASEDVLSRVGDVLMGKGQLFLQNILEQDVSVVVVVRRNAEEHLVKKDA